MFIRLFDLDYPVWEKETESWSRFEVIYKLTAELAVNCQSAPKRNCSLNECWENIVLFWNEHAVTYGDINLLFEALYHLCFRKFSDSVQDPLMMRLILLIEDELQTFSFAFKVWAQMDVFQEAYNNITAHYYDNKIFKKHYDPDLYMYLVHRVVKLVMFKNLEYSNWRSLFPINSNLYPLRPYDIYVNVDMYEEAVTFLIPAATSWYEEWSDSACMISNINQLYGVDFSNDTKGLYSLINAAMHREDIAKCSLYLYGLHECPTVLLQHLWGPNYAEALQLGFLSLCKRYKNAKRRQVVRGRYGHSDFMNNWIYKQINSWRCDHTIVLSKKVKDKLFEVGLDI